MSVYTFTSIEGWPRMAPWDEEFHEDKEEEAITEEAFFPQPFSRIFIGAALDREEVELDCD